MRIDCHQHFWIYNSSDYVWMSDDMDVLRQNFLPDDLAPLLDAAGFQGSVAVQARQQEQETEWLLTLAAEHGFIQGVVGWVDFASPHLDASLEQFAANPKLKGVRELIHDMPELDYAVSETHLRAIGKLERYELSYDLLLRPQHLRPALQLVRLYPDQPFVIDHVAKPDISGGALQPWENGMRELAACSNVYCKLSGMVTEAVWKRWRRDTFYPFLDVVVEAFGTDRVMIGSDWPVCTLSGSYAETMAVVSDYVSAFSDREQEAILGGNAARFYRLEPSRCEASSASFEASNN